MILIACIDDKGGMMFNHRRQSQDRVLREHIIGLIGERQLRVSPYSAKQFGAEAQEKLSVSEEYLEKAGIGEFCFAEGESLLPYENKIEELILFKWNRVYPADLYFDIPLDSHGWQMVDIVEFAGSSHEKITKECYKKVER